MFPYVCDEGTTDCMELAREIGGALTRVPVWDWTASICITTWYMCCST